MTPEQLHQKKLISQSWGDEAASRYENLVSSLDYWILPIWHIFPTLDESSNKQKERMYKLNSLRKQNISRFADYGNIYPRGGKLPEPQVKIGKGISFGYTLPQLLSGQKTVTRRAWSERHSNYMQKNWNLKQFPALSTGYYAGGKSVGFIKITQEPYFEKLSDMPDSDLAAEGFPELSKIEFIRRFFKGDSDLLVCVVRFNFIPDSQEAA